jgi:uncharacterized damage-inducible protein DinB
LLDACAQLTDAQLDATMKGVYGSTRQTLMHLVSSEEGYAWRFNFTGAEPISPMEESDPFPGFGELRRRVERSGKELIAMAEQADLDQVLHLDGGTYDAQVIIVMIQAINHGVDHRSQIATLLSQQDIESPCLDAWCYNDALREKSGE